MNNERNVRHIKRQAKLLKKKLRIQYHEALDKAAVAEGFSNWSHCVNQSKHRAPAFQRPAARRNSSVKPIPVGTLVRFKPRGSAGMVFKSDGSTVEYYDEWGPILAAHEEVAICRDQSAADFKPMRLVLPYGKWTCGDGSEVLYNRDYCPLWKRSADGTVASISPNSWVEHTDEEWFFNDGNRPVDDKRTRLKCIAVLKAWGVENRRSKLLELLPAAIQSGNMKLLKGATYNQDTAAA